MRNTNLTAINGNHAPASERSFRNFHPEKVWNCENVKPANYVGGIGFDFQKFSKCQKIFLNIKKDGILKHVRAQKIKMIEHFMIASKGITPDCKIFQIKKS